MPIETLFLVTTSHLIFLTNKHRNFETGCSQSFYSCFSPASESVRNDTEPSWSDTSGIAKSKSSLVHTLQVELISTKTGHISTRQKPDKFLLKKTGQIYTFPAKFPRIQIIRKLHGLQSSSE